MKEIKECKGITLIALIITVIVLLILAGVSISMLMGQNGILTQAQNAKSQNEKYGALEQVKLAVAASQVENGIDFEKLQNGLNNIVGMKEELKKISRDDFPLTITINETEINLFLSGEAEIAKDMSRPAYVIVYDTGNKLSDGVTPEYNMVIQRGDELDTSKKVILKYENLEELKAKDILELPWCNIRTNIKSIEIKDLVQPSGVNDWFSGLTNCSNITGLRKLDLSNCDNMQGMFSGDVNLKNIDIEYLNTKTIKNYSWTFKSCEGVSILKVDNWNVENGKNFMGMFEYCSGIEQLNLEKWNMSKANTLYRMFAYCTSLKQINGLDKWSTESFKDIGEMFRECKSLTNLNVKDWNTQNVTATYYTFDGCSMIQELDISNWNTLNVINNAGMFDNMEKLKKITIGDKFNFSGTGNIWCTLIKGLWKNSEGTIYKYDEIPNSKADTYVKVEN